MCHVPFVYRNTQNICFLQKRTQNWKSSEGITIDHSAGSWEGKLLQRPHSSVGLPLSWTPTNNEYRQDICYLEGVCCGQIVYGRCMPFFITGNDVLKGQEPNGVCSGFSETKSHWVRVSEILHSRVLQYLVAVLTQRRCCEQNGNKSDSRSLKYETLQILTLWTCS